MVIFKGDNSLQGVNKNVVQQIDIMPTVLDLLNYNKGFFAFGKSMLTSESWALSYLANKYYFISENGFLINKGEDYQLFKDWDLTKKLEVKEEDIRKLKAIKQQYNKAMIENKLLYEN